MEKSNSKWFYRRFRHLRCMRKGPCTFNGNLPSVTSVFALFNKVFLLGLRPLQFFEIYMGPLYSFLSTIVSRCHVNAIAADLVLGLGISLQKWASTTVQGQPPSPTLVAQQEGRRPRRSPNNRRRRHYCTHLGCHYRRPSQPYVTPAPNRHGTFCS